jgi:hypothetical protein
MPILRDHTTLDVEGNRYREMAHITSGKALRYRPPQERSGGPGRELPDLRTSHPTEDKEPADTSPPLHDVTRAGAAPCVP